MSQPLRLYFTSVSTNFSHAPVRSWDDKSLPTRYRNVGGEIRLEAVIPFLPGANEIVQNVLRGDGFDLFQERQEFRCLWCGSMNSIEHRHCSQCGGPRGWLL